MATSEILVASRLNVVPFSERYLTDQYVGWLNDPHVVRYSEQRHRSHTLASCRSYWQSFDRTPHYFWAILELGEAPAHIGNINAYVDENNRLADVGILIGARSAWGKGYGTEAWLTVCDFLLREKGLRKVTAGALASNKAMIGIARRAGMIEEGRRIRHYLWEGREIDVVYFSLFKEQRERMRINEA